MPPSTSLVYPGVNGKLVYVEDSLGNRIPDFSHAGYRGGDAAIPFTPVKKVVWPVLGDNSANIQAAIDSVSALPMDETGFRGAILLKMGIYQLDSPIFIRASGVVLRGEGRGDTGTILWGKISEEQKGPPFRRPALVNIAGESGAVADEKSLMVIRDEYVPVGARRFRVRSAKGFRPGDKVLVRRHGNQKWIEAIGQDSLTVGRNRWKPFTISYDRVITHVSKDTITIDAPIFTAIETQWGGGDIVKYTDSGRIENVGVENLRGISEFNPAVRTSAYGNMDRPSFNDPVTGYTGEEYFSDENHYFVFINVSNAKNVWVRNMTALHFAGSVVNLTATTKWVTVQDCESREPVSIRLGARRFTFQLSGQLALAQRCHSQKGRHSFVLQGSGASGNVFYNCTAANPYSTSEPHNRWVNGVLYDNVKAPLTARYWKDFIIGWAGANIVFWNCEGDFVIQKPPTAQNYSFGHIGTIAVIYNLSLQDFTKPYGYIESLDKHVAPKSLFISQLKERIGDQALQKALNPTWSEQP